MSTLSSIQSIDPYEFEELVAEVWSAQGYETKVRQGSNDKGVDIEAISGNHKILIQAKRYSANNKVGGPDVRKYATLYQQDPTANQVLIITTSSFTSQAKEIAAEQNITIVDGNEFVNMLDEHNISLKKFDQKTNTYSASKPNKTDNWYFDKCPVCGDDNLWAKKVYGVVKCSQCESKWKKEEISDNYGENIPGWRGISGEAQGKLKTTDEWKHYSTDTEFHNEEASSESKSPETEFDDQVPDDFETLARVPLMILLLSTVHSLISWSFHSYQLWLVVITVILLLISAVNQVWKGK